MIDIKFIINDKTNVITALKNRNFKNIEVLDQIEKLYLDFQSKNKLFEELRANQNKIGEGLRSINKNSQEYKDTIENLTKIKKEVQNITLEKDRLENEYITLLQTIPNIPDKSVPIGKNEDENLILEENGIKRTFDFTPKEHWLIAQELGILDSERAAKVSGARFNYLKGDLVMLQFALINYVFNLVTDVNIIKSLIEKADLNLKPKAYIPILPPVIVRIETMKKMARLMPGEQTYLLTTDESALVASAEHSIGSMHMNETFDIEDLPIRYVGYSTAFRR